MAASGEFKSEVSGANGRPPRPPLRNDHHHGCSPVHDQDDGHDDHDDHDRSAGAARPVGAASGRAGGAEDRLRPDLFAHWVDADGDRCDTREEVLIAESRTPAQVDPYGCKVVAGDWSSIYDGVSTDQPGDLDIDHVVALAEASDSGAAAWDAARRRAFANDLDEPAALIAVTASSNRSKSDEDPAEWQPRVRTGSRVGQLRIRVMRDGHSTSSATHGSPTWPKPGSSCPSS
jgi:hypothetical protein